MTCPRRRQKIPIQLIGLVVIAVAVIALLLAGRSLLVGRLRPADGPLPDVQAIVQRGGQLIGQSEPSSAWIKRINQGRASLDAYLLRLFTSYDYLAMQAPDNDFISDAVWVVTGQTLNMQADAQAQAVLDSSGSRLRCLESILENQGFGLQLSDSTEPTRLRTMTLQKNDPAFGREVVGLMSLTAEARLSGNDASFQIYANGHLRSAMAADSDHPELLQQYGMNWDTREEQPGDYDLKLLVRTSDGRAALMDIGTYQVPDITALDPALALETVSGPGQAMWLELPVENGTAQMTVVQANGPASLVLVDQHNAVLSESGTVSGQPAALRSLIGLDNLAGSDSCYVRISSDAPVELTLVGSPLAAFSKTDGQWHGALEVEGEQVLVLKPGGSTWQSTGDFRIIDPVGRLSELELVLPDGSQAEFALSFDPDTMFYALVVDQNVSDLQLVTRTMEGSAATLIASVQDETGQVQTLEPGQMFALDLSENILRIDVAGFDTVERTTEINILRLPHSGGYDEKLTVFPAGYRSPLWRLHLLHPDWQFQAMDTGIDWTSFVQAQDETDRSLVNASYSPASWIETGSPVYDGTSWMAAATGVIEHFADPRNFLDDQQVFQFEEMTFNEIAQTRQGVEAILDQSFMAAGNAGGIDYAGIFLDAGQTAGISPYYLAARAIQEMGRQGQSPLAHGTLDGYEGYYNFYNIGSTPDPSVENGAQINGARYAMYGRKADEQEITPEEAEIMLPWDSPEKAIAGGALWIAARYVAIGQDTLYLQKFDLIAEDGLYVHQYAQNIQMAWSEAWNSEKAYSSIGLLEQGFVFSIPVFENMPLQPASWPG